jgi:hypothetical protein
MMARANLPTGGMSVNSAHTKTSYLLLIARRNPFPTALGVNSPVADINNSGLTFTATVVSVAANQKSAILKLVAINPPGGGIIPLDGILSITLIDQTDLSNPVNIPVADIPVDYVSDPGAP